MLEVKQFFILILILFVIVVIIYAALHVCTKDPFVSNTKRLKPKTRYKSGKHRYVYKTDKLSRIVKVKVRRLKFGEPESNWSQNTLGKRQNDHAGHLIGNRFGGSNDLDNLVSMKESVNLGTFKILENKWAKAISNKEKVSLCIKIEYNGKSKRPDVFKIKYKINGKTKKEKIKN